MIKRSATRRIGLFLPTENPYYQHQFLSIKRAFHGLGVEVTGGAGLLNEPELLEFVRQVKPDTIIEMNRSRLQVPFLPRSVKHVAWMVDVADWPYKLIDDSEIVYFFGANWYRNFPPRNGSLVKWLPPGTCTRTYFPEHHTPLCDVSFVGHIPKPWSAHELGRPIFGRAGQAISFGELVEACSASWNKDGMKNYDNQAYLQSSEAIASQILRTEVVIDDSKLRYDISCRAVRVLNRKKMIDLAMTVTKDIQIFGPQYWRMYPKYKNYYRSFLTDQSHIREVYQSSRASLHEGVGLHNRVFDCMASGGLVFYRRTADDDSSGGINQFFEPWIHYIPVDEESDRLKLTAILQGTRVRKVMGAQAATLVSQKHTWANRAREILRDLAEV